MWTSCFLFSVYVSLACTSKLEHFDSDGWVPVSSDVVFNQIRRGITQGPRYTKNDGDDTGRVTSHHQEYDNKPVRDITHEVIESCDKGSLNCVEDTLKNSELQFEYGFNPNYFLPENKEEATVRKSKKLSDTITFVNNVIPSKNEKVEFDIKLRNYHKFEKKTHEDIHMYEVTENVFAEDIMQETELKANGYEYNTPDKQNTTNLFQYLSKYNIKVDDNLRNYALSRRQKTENHVTHIPSNPLQFQTPIRSYNSLNHLPVNPLLAVFLSNYGYYLQGQYGIHNQYNNLYGYLASNNIHNNKPFGFYKLYSDTDAAL